MLQPCTSSLSTMTPGDGIDNDCDGEIDEDYCNGTDRTKDCAVPTPSKTTFLSQDFIVTFLSSIVTLFYFPFCFFFFITVHYCQLYLIFCVLMVHMNNIDSIYH